MRNYSIILILAVSSILAMPQFPSRAENKHANIYSVDGEKIRIYTGDSIRSASVGGNIEKHFRGDDGVYYIAIKAMSGVNAAYIGCADLLSGDVRYEKRLLLDIEKFAMGKFMVAEGIAYLLAEPRTSTVTGRVLSRINLNSMEVDHLPDVLDYHVDKQDLVLLVKRESGMLLCRNEVTVPVSLIGEGPLWIKEVVDGRMIFVTNGEETEIIDIRASRGLYQYSNKRELLMPEGYNLVVDIKDIQGAEHEDREMVFYKVFIDGIDSGRTDSGPARLSREFRAKIDANKYHLVKLERWTLNAAKGRYDRENNIRQPKTEHIYIPINRIVKLNITFNGKNYHYEIAPVYK